MLLLKYAYRALGKCRVWDASIPQPDELLLVADFDCSGGHVREARERHLLEQRGRCSVMPVEQSGQKAVDPEGQSTRRLPLRGELPVLVDAIRVAVLQ